ncbi:MAG: hypothetical protein MI725_02430 [Pirellulales bacterium]|nr:hypothetical protein [Pirellulales bacterium]
MMLMPEAAMHQNGDPILGQNNIRCAGQIGPMNAKSVTQRVKDTANSYFWFRVTLHNLTHV